MKDSVSRRSRGFGFITFADASSVDRVLAQAEHIIDSRRVEAKRAVPRADTGKAPDPASGVTRTAPSSAPAPAPAAPAAPASSVAVAPAASAPAPAPPTSSSGPPLSAAAAAAVAAATAAQTTKIFVGGLHYETRDAQFRSYFEQFGRVVSAEVMFNRETRKSRGFGFVVFEAPGSALAVLHSAHHTIGGKLVEVKPAIPRTVKTPELTAVPAPTALPPPTSVGRPANAADGAPAPSSSVGLVSGSSYASVLGMGKAGSSGASVPAAAGQGHWAAVAAAGGGDPAPSSAAAGGAGASASAAAAVSHHHQQMQAQQQQQAHQQRLHHQQQQQSQEEERRRSSVSSNSGGSGFSPYQLPMDAPQGNATDLSPFFMPQQAQHVVGGNMEHHTADGMLEAAMAELHLGGMGGFGGLGLGHGGGQKHFSMDHFDSTLPPTPSSGGGGLPRPASFSLSDLLAGSHSPQRAPAGPDANRGHARSHDQRVVGGGGSWRAGEVVGAPWDMGHHFART
jgi:RNA recognition motif-containing protein